METEVDISQIKENALAYAAAPWYERLKKRKKFSFFILILLIVAVLSVLFLISRSANAAVSSYNPWYAYDEDGNSIEFQVGTDYNGNFEEAYLASDSTKTSVASSWEEFYEYLDENNLTTTYYAGASVNEETEWYEELAYDAFKNHQYLAFFSLLILGSLSNICEAGLSLVNQLMNYTLANMSDIAMDYLTGTIGGDTYTVKDVDVDGSYSTTSYSTALLNSIGETIYSFIRTIADDIVEPAAVALLSLVLLFSLLKIASRFDAGGGTMPAVREVLVLCVCAAFYIWFVGNAFNVMSLVFSFFQALLSDAMGTVDTGTISLNIDYTLEESDITSDGSYVLSTIWWYVIVYFVSLFMAVWILSAVIKFGLKLICTCLMRGIQIYILLAFSPLPFTFLGLDETRQWGIGYIRHFAMVSLQGLVIYIVAYIFPILVTSMSALSMSAATGIAELVLWALVTRALIETATTLLEHAGELASSVFGG